MTHVCDGSHKHSPEYMREIAKKPTILGIDPGVSTGIAIAHFASSKWHFITSTHTDVETVWELVDVPVEVVVCERFSAQLISKYGLHTVDLIGGIKALAWLHGVQYIEHTPTQRKPFIEYARSRVAPDPDMTRHDQRHEIDALSHVIRYMYHHQYITSLEVV